MVDCNDEVIQYLCNKISEELGSNTQGVLIQELESDQKAAASFLAGNDLGHLASFFLLCLCAHANTDRDAGGLVGTTKTYDHKCLFDCRGNFHFRHVRKFSNGGNRLAIGRRCRRDGHRYNT